MTGGQNLGIDLNSEELAAALGKPKGMGYEWKTCEGFDYLFADGKTLRVGEECEYMYLQLLSVHGWINLQRLYNSQQNREARLRQLAEFLLENKFSIT